MRAKWWATVSSGDLDGYLGLFADDAVWVTPELDEVVGRDAIRAWLEPVFAQFDYELTITVADVRVAGNLGIERARFISRMTPKPPSLRLVPPAAPPPSDEPAPDASDEPVGGEDLDGTTEGGAGDPDPHAGPAVEGPDQPRVEDSPESAPGAGDVDGPELAAPADAEVGAGAESESESGSAGESGSADTGADAGSWFAADADADAGPGSATDDGPAAVDGPAEVADEGLGATQEDDATDEGEGDDTTEEDDEVDAPLVAGDPDGGDDEPHEGRYLMYWRWHDDRGWLVQRYADVTGVG